MGLIAIADIEAYTGVTYDSDESAVMSNIIDAVGAYFEYYCDTKFTDDVYSERISIIDGQFSLKNNFQYFYGVFTSPTNVIEITPPSPNCSVIVADNGDTLSLISLFTKSDIDMSAQKISQTVTSINLVSGWSATAVSGINDYYSKTLFPGTWRANENDSNKITLIGANTMYDVSQKAQNLFQIANECDEGISVYQGGYATVPADLQDACIRFCAKAYKERKATKNSGNVKSENIGDYSYEIDYSSAKMIGLSIEYYDILNKYKIKDI